MNMIKRATVSLPGDDSGNVANTQVTYLGRTAQVEVIYPYGTAGKAPKDSSSVMLNIQAQEENRVIIEYRPVDRFKNLKPGEYVVGNQLTGSNVLFREDGVAVFTGPVIFEDTVTFNNAVIFKSTVTSNGKDISSTHGHAQDADSNGDTQEAISGVT
jgi:hypothetical protein